MIKKESKILYISSIAACTPIPYSSTYSSSKAALEAYVLSKINEYDEKTKHIIIQPGNINTGLMKVEIIIENLIMLIINTIQK